MSAILRAAWRTGFAVLVLACFGCVKNVVIGAPGSPNADLFLTDFQFDGVLKPHFGSDPDACGLRHRQGAPNPGRTDWTNTGNSRIRDSDWVWLVAGEGLCAYWTTLALTTEPAGRPGESSTCDLCAFLPQRDGGCPVMPGSGWPDSGDGFENVGRGLEIRIYAWPLPIFDVRDRVAEFGWATGCATPARPTDPRVAFPEFRPERSARLQVATFPHGGASEIDASLAVVWRGSFGVLLAPAGGVEMEMPPRLLEPDPARPGRFTWQVATLDGGRLDENFSPNLRVSRLRVAKFKVDPARRSPDSVGRHRDFTLTKVEDLAPPYVPTNVQMGHRCVYPTGSTDGSIPITECRRGDGGMTLIAATPVYEIVPPAPGLASVISDPIRWEINYEAGGNFAIPTLEPDEQLGVIFILRAVR